MADKTITQLSAASTPLAGTEVLPIVQSGATVKVATDNLTVKNIRSNATTGLLQVTGPAAAATRVMTTPDADFTVARTDAANSFTGDQTLSTGNIIIGTSGKGVNFSAVTPGPSNTSQLLADYEEGSFSPVLKDAAAGNAATATTYARYTKIGRVVQFQLALININTTGLTAGNDIFITGLPYTNSNVANAYVPASFYADYGINSTTGAMNMIIYQGTSLLVVYNGLTTGGAAAKISQIVSGTGSFYICGTYQTP